MVIFDSASPYYQELSAKIENKYKILGTAGWIFVDIIRKLDNVENG